MRKTSALLKTNKKIESTLAEHKESFNGCCELCGDKSDKLVLDHEHALPYGCGQLTRCVDCGEARGYICQNCNLRIVMGSDDCIKRGKPFLVSRVVYEYLTESPLRQYKIVCHPYRKRVLTGWEHDPLWQLTDAMNYIPDKETC